MVEEVPEMRSFLSFRMLIPHFAEDGCNSLAIKEIAVRERLRLRRPEEDVSG